MVFGRYDIFDTIAVTPVRLYGPTTVITALGNMGLPVNEKNYLTEVVELLEETNSHYIIVLNRSGREQTIKIPKDGIIIQYVGRDN